jgi:hypothetical protein
MQYIQYEKTQCKFHSHIFVLLKCLYCYLVGVHLESMIMLILYLITIFHRHAMYHIMILNLILYSLRPYIDA